MQTLCQLDLPQMNYITNGASVTLATVAVQFKKIKIYIYIFFTLGLTVHHVSAILYLYERVRWGS